MDTKALFEYIDSRSEDILDFLKKICSYEATAYDKTTLDALVEFIDEYARSLGLTTEKTVMEKCGSFLTLDINPTGEKSAVFLAHLDTVHEKGSFGATPVKIEGNKLIAPGATDCKGGCAIALFVLAALKASGYKKNARLILTTDEEVSNSLGGENEVQFFIEKTKGYTAALNCEVTEKNEVIVSRKGILKYRITVHGVGGHAGIKYFECVNPVLECARKIVALEGASTRDGNTYSCNIISGGTLPNIIPESCFFTVDARVPSHSGARHAEALIEQIANTDYTGGTHSEAVKLGTRPPMEYNADTERLFASLNSLSKKLGQGELTAICSGGGSDSAYTQRCGVPSICGVGAPGGLYHTVGEYAEIDKLVPRTKLLAAFLAENFV